MPNIEVSKPKAPATARPRDFFDAMRQEMDRLFDRFDFGPRWPATSSAGDGQFMVPDVDVRDTGSALLIEAELPGVSEKELSVTFADGVLRIKGEKKSQREEKKDNYYLSERSFGSFERSLALPESADDSRIEARFEKGVLHVTVPKKAEAVKSAKQIEVKSS